jgi:hypothetical protein
VEIMSGTTQELWRASDDELATWYKALNTLAASASHAVNGFEGPHAGAPVALSVVRARLREYAEIKPRPFPLPDTQTLTDRIRGVPTGAPGGPDTGHRNGDPVHAAWHLIHGT